MFFEYDITVTKNTTEYKRQVTNIKLPGGVITKAEIQFPDGCAGLVHVRVRMGNFHLWPRNEYGSIKGNDAIITIDEYHKLKHGWNALTVETWNLDDTYDHTVTIRIIVQPYFLAKTDEILRTIAWQLDAILRRIGIR